MLSLVEKNHLIKTFIQMVSIDSESGNEKSFSSYILKLGASLGASSKKDKFGNIYLFFKGQGDSIMLNTHMDTVSLGNGVKAKVSGNYIVTDGTTILGADSKAGIASMIEAIRIIKQKKVPHKNLTITLTCNEESGIPTADKIKSDVKICIVPDRGTPLGEIITEAPYDQVFEVEVKGKTVYAPTDYLKGIHAIDSAVEMINSIPRGNIDKYTTVNIGVLNGGGMTSMVPERCVFKGSCYSFNNKSLKEFLKKLEKVVKEKDKKFGTNSTVKKLEYFGGYKINKADPLVKLAENAIQKAGIKPVLKVYKAVTNANLLNQIGIKSILLSTGVENQHTVKERIAVKTLVDLTQILTNIIVR